MLYIDFDLPLLNIIVYCDFDLYFVKYYCILYIDFDLPLLNIIVYYDFDLYFI
jgi:hypothetical protein